MINQTRIHIEIYDTPPPIRILLYSIGMGAFKILKDDGEIEF
jgi:hypothetical protein